MFSDVGKPVQEKKNPPHFPFNILEDKFTIMVSVKAVRKGLFIFSSCEVLFSVLVLMTFLFL